MVLKDRKCHSFFQILESCACENLQLGFVKCVHTAGNEEIKLNWILQLGADYFVRRGTYQKCNACEKKIICSKLIFFFSSKEKNFSNSKNDNVLLFRWDEFIVYKDFEKFTTYFFRFAIKENTHIQKIDNISSSVCRMAN